MTTSTPLALPEPSRCDAGARHDGGVRRRRVLAFDWATTPLGSIELWPARLQSGTDRL